MIKDFFARAFDVRARDERDYYIFSGWLVSKRFAVMLLAVIIVCCTVFLWCASPMEFHRENGIKTYKYNALFLKFATGKVRILGKSGYTAYVGEVENGVVKGSGILYDSDGNVVYEGEFDANAYNGQGKYYQGNAQPVYEGEFRDNLYCGEGRLYRDSGMLWYAGNFDRGHREGAGTLYSAAGKEVYSGNFQNGRILYEEFIGRSTAEIADRYRGERAVYVGDDVYCVHMEEIDAIYFGADRSNALEEDFRVAGLYVLMPDICADGDILSEVSQLEKVFGNPVYEGNTFLQAEEEVALNVMCGTAGNDVLYGKAEYSASQIYDDVTQVSDFEKDYQVYIYVYERDGILYTFYCQDRGKGFAFYRIE